MLKTRQTPSLLFLIGFVEFFERFGFYAMQGLLVLFLIKTKHMSSDEAYHTFGAFSALLFGFVGLGGYCGDKFLGPRKTMFLGLWVMFAGYLGLSLAADKWFYSALAAVCIGNALFKANPAAIIGHIYQDSEEKLHAAFTLFYMAVNYGSLLALLLAPFLASHYSYEAAFAASAAGILIAIITVFVNQAQLEVKQTNHVLPAWSWYKSLVGVFVLFGFWYLTAFLLASYEWVILGLKILITFILAVYLYACFKEQGLVRMKMFAVLILMAEAVVFFTLYQQMPTSLNMYAVMHVHPDFWGMHFDPQSFQALNPFWIVVFSPILAHIYKKNSGSQHAWTIFEKFALGMFLCGISYFILYISHFFASQDYYVSQLWLVFSYVFQSLAELLVSALGLAMVAELVPSYRMGGVMGMWFLTSAVSGFTGAKLASMTVVPHTSVASYASFMGFANVFGQTALITIILSIIMFIFSPFLRKLTHQ